MPTATSECLKKNYMVKQSRNTRSPLIPSTQFLFIFFFFLVYTIVKFCLLFVVYLIKVICFSHSCMMLTNSDIQEWWFSTTKHNTCSQNMESVFILIWQIMKFFKNHTLQFQTQNEVTIQKTSFYIKWNISKCFNDQKYLIKFTMKTEIYAAVIFLSHYTS